MPKFALVLVFVLMASLAAPAQTKPQTQDIPSQLEALNLEIASAKKQVETAQATIDHGVKMYHILEPVEGWASMLGAVASLTCLASQFSKAAVMFRRVTCSAAGGSYFVTIMAAKMSNNYTKEVEVSTDTKRRFTYELEYDQREIKGLQLAYSQMKRAAP